MPSTLDNIFRLLQEANELEEKKENRIEAATKYYEAVYLIRRYAQKLPETEKEADARQLLLDKAGHYERVASDLMTAALQPPSSSLGGASDDRGDQQSDNLGDSSSPSYSSSLSPLHKATFFHEDSSVVPIPPPSQPSPDSDSCYINFLASQANHKLVQALDRDESVTSTSSSSLPSEEEASVAREKAAVVALYMEAAELYLQAIQRAAGDRSERKTCDNSHDDGDGRHDNLSVLKRRLQSILDRVEAIKVGKGKAASAAAPRRTVIEQSKVGEPKSGLPSAEEACLVQQQQEYQRLTDHEIAVLKRSSLIASGLFLPWSDDDARLLSERAHFLLLQNVNNKQRPMSLFTDADGFLKLSKKQQTRFFRWARPAEIAQIRHRSGLSKKLQSVEVIRTVTPYTIRQQCVTDCSFIASLCICASLERQRRSSKLVSSLLYPQAVVRATREAGKGERFIEVGTPVVSPEGRYMVRLWLNGVARCVVVDDYLPIDERGNLLCSQSSLPSAAYLELWVCLIEKAYMKLCGGYDFPGSNSGVDLFSLTGWIPERILFAHDPRRVRDFETAPDRAWERLLGASSYGDCLITVSTERGGLNSPSEDVQATGLVTGHAYAVLTVLQTRNGTRLLQLKNPWAHQSWTGRYSPGDAKGWRDPAFCAEVGYDPSKARLKDDGVFWICWEDVLTHFNNFHLSWNPALFRNVFRTHGLWRADQGPQDDTFNVGENPQYVLELSEQAIQRKATVWILVSRHVTKQEQEGSEATDFLTVHVHRNTAKRQRVWYAGRNGGCILTGAYTNNPHVLARVDLQGPQDAHLTLVLSQYQKSRDLGYTLSCFCTEPFSLGDPAQDLEYSVRKTSAWTAQKSGGPLGSPLCEKNPTFALHVPEISGRRGKSTKVQIRLTSVSNPAAALNAVAFPVETMGDGMRRATAGPVLDSGKYRHGFCITETSRLPAGSYAIVASTYTPGMLGSLELVVASSSSKIQVKEIG